jgi:ADP-L-glycero-D-manno-heptose 6-epimerase
MTKQPTIVITGTAGFIGSVMVQYLNEKGLTNLLLVDDFGVQRLSSVRLF